MSGRRSPAEARPESSAPGARPDPGASTGCARPGCGHPRALHSNGQTPCKAFACSAGPCQECMGSTMNTDGSECAACHGRGTGGPCPEFVSQAAEPPERRLLAS
jgi:hypothetical protein